MVGHGEMRLRGIGPQPQSIVDCCFTKQIAFGRWIQVEEIEKIVRARGVTVGQNKIRITLGCFVEQPHSLEQRRPGVLKLRVSVDNLLGLQIQIERR